MADIKGHAKWDAIKYLAGLAIAAAYLLLQKIRHLELDWRAAGGLFAVSVLLLSRFRLSYYSPAQAEIETNTRKAARTSRTTGKASI